MTLEEYIRQLFWGDPASGRGDYHRIRNLMEEPHEYIARVLREDGYRVVKTKPLSEADYGGVHRESVWISEELS